MLIDSNETLPYLTEDLPGIGGIIKLLPEDFRVEELPLYEPCGEGTHTYIQIKKTRLATMDALVQIGRALHIPHQQIGYAGLKDAQAITTQWISIEHIENQAIETLDLENINVLQTKRHTNKLKMGHLQANRFTIRIRHFDGPLEQVQANTQKILTRLIQKGVPNYFGPQRFGKRYDSHLLGSEIIQKNPERMMDLLLGLPDKFNDNDACYDAREFYEQREFEKAYNAWSPSFHDRRKALRTIMKNAPKSIPKAKQRAFNFMDKRMKRFYVSAFQSDLFNQVLTRRLNDVNDVHQIEIGDIACKHENGACFPVTDALAEQPRCDRFEISPTGPMYGYRMSQPDHRPGQIESEILSQYHLTAEDFKQMGYYKIKGTRRPLRFQPKNANLHANTDPDGPYLQLNFDLPPGSYATTLLREIIKPPNEPRP
jgi:tRNA pseudouridine13 synthase